MLIRLFAPVIAFSLAIFGVGYWLAIQVGLIDTYTVTFAHTVWADASDLLRANLDTVFRV